MLDELAMTFGGEARVFRQQRDLRFTPDKTPYKTRTYGFIPGTPVPGPGLYAQLSVSGLYAGTGYYRLARDQLERFRAAVADDARRAAARGRDRGGAGAGLELAGQSLRTAPRGYPRDHPRIELLRRKALIAGRALGAGGGIAPRRRARPRRRRVAGRGAAQRLARRARRAEHPPARRAWETSLTVRKTVRGRGDDSVAGPPGNRHPARFLPSPHNLRGLHAPLPQTRRPARGDGGGLASQSLDGLEKSNVRSTRWRSTPFPADITTGLDGALWAPDGSLGRLWRVTTRGKVSSIDTGVGTGPAGVATGPTAPSGSPIATTRSTASRPTARSPRTLSPPLTRSRPRSSPAPTARSGSPSPRRTQIGRSRRAGRSPSSRFRRPMPGPAGLTVGPDGALWFTESSANTVGRITTSGR